MTLKWHGTQPGTTHPNMNQHEVGRVIMPLFGNSFSVTLPFTIKTFFFLFVFASTTNILGIPPSSLALSNTLDSYLNSFIPLQISDLIYSHHISLITPCLWQWWIIIHRLLWSAWSHKYSFFQCLVLYHCYVKCCGKKFQLRNSSMKKHILKAMTDYVNIKEEG